MASTNPAVERRTATLTDIDGVDRGVRNAKDDAISDREFELLLETTYGMDEYYGRQCRLILWLAGRLGMRRGELGHMTRDWVDFDRGVIEIPSHYPCDKGRDGGICGDCRGNAEQKAAVRTRNRYADAHQRLGPKDEYEPGGGEAVDAVVPKETFETEAWSPKTDTASRTVPFSALTARSRRSKPSRPNQRTCFRAVIGLGK
jgi:hypothetical protein